MFVSEFSPGRTVASDQAPLGACQRHEPVRADVLTSRTATTVGDGRPLGSVVDCESSTTAMTRKTPVASEDCATG